MGMYLSFAMVALRAITSKLDPTTDVGILASKVVDILGTALDIAQRTGALNAPLPPGTAAPDLPPQPWTPQGVLDWAQTQEFGSHPEGEGSDA
jgi:hypothetical protein